MSRLSDIPDAASSGNGRCEAPASPDADRLRLAIEASGLGVFDYDPRTNRHDWSERAKAIWGLSPGEEVRPERVWAVVSPEDRARSKRTAEASLDPDGSGEFAVEHRVVHADGSVRWVALRGRTTFAGEGAGRHAVRCTGTMLDVTDRRRAEEEFRRLNAELARRVEEFQTLLDVLPVGIGIALDAECRDITTNAAFARMLRLTEGRNASKTALEDLRPVHFRVLDDEGREIPPDRLPMQLAAREGRVVDGVEFDIAFDDGQVTRFLEYVAPLFDDSGRPRGAVGAFMDITDRRRVEEALRESEERYRTLFESIDEGFCVVEMLFDAAGRPVDYRFLEGNPAFAAHTGLEGAVGKTALELVPDLDRWWIETYGRVAVTGEPIRFEKRDEAMGRWFEVYAFRFGRPEKRAVAIFFKNVTDQKRAEQALRDAEEQFRTLADGIPQLAWMARPDGHIFWYNRRWYDYTGATPEAQEGWGWESVHDPAELPRVAAKWKAALAVGEPWEDMFPLRRRDGEMRCHLSRAMPVRDESGRIVRWFGTNTDVEGARRAARTNRFLADASAALAELLDYESTLRRVAQAAVPAFADWCVIDVLDGDGAPRRLAVAHADPAKAEVARLLAERYPPRADTRQGVPKVLRTGEPELVAEVTEAHLEAVAADEGHLRLIRQVGPRSYICVPILSKGRTLGAMTFTAAESRRCFDEDDLIAAQDLARRAAVAIENAELYTAIKEADRRKDEFLATLGHELRNPLASIVNAAEAMAGGRDREGDGEMLEIVERQARHMSRLIDDLLDIARIARGKILLRAERLDFAEIVRETAEDHRREVEDAGLTLAVEILNRPLWVSGDRTRLAQVVGNVLHNAAKFTDSGGRIDVSVALERQQALLRIRDSGLGIIAEMLARIFVPFNQADASLARSRGGLGLGLALVKGLVELHGGTVVAKSEGLGTGTEFLIRLPLTALAEKAATRDDDDGAGQTRMRILAIDDRRDILRPMQVLLTRDGHEVELMTDGRAGFEAAKRLLPDVVICDIGLPGEMNGHDVARALRRNPETAATFLIALTGYGQESDRQAALAAGFDLHLTKPIDIRVLRTVLAGVTPDERR